MNIQTRCIIQDGYIIPPSHLELIVADHCNISCRQCNHASPAVPKWFADPEEVKRDLGILARIYKPRYIKLIGGEPLLHPKLAEVIFVARNSGISDYFLLVTNGMLLDRLSDDVWQLIDEIEISRYASAGLTESSLKRAKEKAEKFAVRFTLNDYPEFRRTFTRKMNTDGELVDRIFRACKMANVWGCHALHKGRIYRCSQSIYVPSLVDNSFSEGIKITDHAGFRDALLEFLNSQNPLQSCQYCVGTAGRKQHHQLLPRKEWLPDLDEPVENIIDWQLLEKNLQEVIPLDDCKQPAHARAIRHKIKVGFPYLNKFLPSKKDRVE